MSPSRAPKSMRLFVAVYPPRETADTLLALLKQLALPPHRLVGAEQIHVTLHFIGETPTRKVDVIGEMICHAAGGLESFALTPQQLIALPRHGSARLVAAATDRPPGLMELQRRLVTRLARKPRKDAGDRFRPHLTLCRFRAPARISPIETPVDVPSFPVATIALVRSTLRPEGAQHETVRAVALSRPSP